MLLYGTLEQQLNLQRAGMELIKLYFGRHKVVLTKDVKDDLAEELGVAVEEINRICRLAGCLLAVLYGVNINSYCTWCPYVDCIPFTSWHCKDKETFCELDRCNWSNYWSVYCALG
ncbi:uncharacterized protein LOC131626478 isoform X2 [Vicia villosa]|uniref:uncharacterized protein LOC131602137 isoform X3 n=1 Tax=Vicia villosa TaxID=3911 RepID=UPI00273B86D3|nr:uncharacterized protein LOC131602137 isoform X3 [Vicia villosa]XP_058753302.1 uncharacterized protein LOC131626478 isoform X2 [Vicia villosa]